LIQYRGYFILERRKKERENEREGELGTFGSQEAWKIILPSLETREDALFWKGGRKRETERRGELGTLSAKSKKICVAASPSFSRYTIDSNLTTSSVNVTLFLSARGPSGRS
jgi:hypothetical protein